MKVEKFEENKYKNWKQDPNESFSEIDKSLINGNEKVRILTNGETVQVEETNINNLYGIVKVYSIKTMQLESILYQFDEMPINMYKLYDENGKLIKEENMNMPYLFSVEDLIEKFKKEYNIDIENPQNVFKINRYEEKKHLKIPLYELGLNKKIPNVWDFYLINGNNGNILYHMTVHKGDRKILLDEYLKNKN